MLLVREMLERADETGGFWRSSGGVRSGGLDSSPLKVW